jgi:chemotaxis response regulator CheB
MIKLLIVDDSVTIRAMIETLLEKDPEINIVGIASNADEAFELIEAHDPHVVTLDIAMPGKDGMTILDEIMATDPRPVIMLSSLMREGDAMVDDALVRGALACFNKTKVVQDIPVLIEMIKTAAPERKKMRDARNDYI